jgi:hypothetical protein
MLRRESCGPSVIRQTDAYPKLKDGFPREVPDQIQMVNGNGDCASDEI